MFLHLPVILFTGAWVVLSRGCHERGSSMKELPLPPVNWNAFLLNRFIPVEPNVDPSFHVYSPSVALSFNPISTRVTTNNAISVYVG